MDHALSSSLESSLRPIVGTENQYIETATIVSFGHPSGIRPLVLSFVMVQDHSGIALTWVKGIREVRNLECQTRNAEFDAILSAGVTAEDFAKLNIPVRLICGTNTRRSARRVAEILAATLPNVEYIEVEGAAHMAPVTQAKLINPLIVENVLGAMEERVDVAA